MHKQEDVDKAVLMVAFAKMDVLALVIALGVISGLGFFLATAALLLRGAPEGMVIGPHLALFSVYFPGYSVSWGGSVIGALYAGAVGAIVGAIVSILWNLTHYLYIILIVIRAHWWRMMAE